MDEGNGVKAIGRADLLAERAYQELKNSILSFRLTPGTRLSVLELSERMGLSRSPVREAVQRLIHDGLATNVPYRGAEVSKVDLADLRQLYMVREQLEGLAARLATEALDAKRMERLEWILDQHAAVLETGGEQDGASGEQTHVELDMEFHRITREAADNAHLTSMLDNLQGKSHLAVHSLWRSGNASQLALAEHRRIYEAMVAGDPEQAEKAAREHIARLRVRLSQAVVRDPSSSSCGSDRPAS